MKLRWKPRQSSSSAPSPTPAEFQGPPPGYIPTEKLFPAWERALRILYWITPVLLLAGGWLVYKNRSREFVRAEFPPARLLLSGGQLSVAPALSPDGRQVAFASDRDGSEATAIWVSDLDGNARRLTKSTWPETDPEFSPDGSTIVYRSEEAGGGLYAIPVSGGTPRRIADKGWRPRYSPDGRWIAYFEIQGEGSSYGYGRIFVVTPDGKVNKPLAADFHFARHPVWIDNRTVLFEGTDARDASDWWVVNLDSAQPPVRTGAFLLLSEALKGRRGSPERFQSGRVIFTASTDGPMHLWDLEIRRGDWQAAGVPRQLTEGPANEARPGISGNRLVYTRGSRTAEVFAVQMDTNQPGESIGELAQLSKQGGLALLPMISTKGDRLLYVSDRTGTPDVWLQTLGSEAERLTVFRTIGFHPVLAPDGSRVSLALSDEEGCAIDTRDLESGEETIVEGCYHLWDVSGDGRTTLVFRPQQAIKTIELLSSPGRTVPIISHPSLGAYSARFSPDGKWVAFTLGLTSGDAPLYLAPFRGAAIPESQWIRIPGAGGGVAAWSPDGGTIYTRSFQDGYACLYAQRLDVAKRPAGPLIPIRHFHSSAANIGLLSAQEFYLTAARDKLVFNVGRETATVWTSEMPE
jgi:Tol biopolymer transport system component